MAYEKIVSVPSTATSGQVPQADGAGGVSWEAVDAYTKTQTLTEATKTAYGLDTSAVPDDVFNTVKGLLDSGVKIATSSYRGTGTYGASNPNSLTFDFEPKVLLFPMETHGGRLYTPGTYGWGSEAFIIPCSALTTTYVAFGNNARQSWSKSSDGKTVRWYSSSDAQLQFNKSGYVYHYIAIG